MRNVALLDSRAQEANRRREEAAAELKLIQTSIASLRQEKLKIRRQKMESVHWLEQWKSRGQAGTANCNGFLGLIEELPELAAFSLSDLRTATCNFSESFKLGQGGYGCVYKGEMLGRTVAIKKLHPNSMQGQSEFQKEVSVFSVLSSIFSMDVRCHRIGRRNEEKTFYKFLFLTANPMDLFVLPNSYQRYLL